MAWFLYTALALAFAATFATQAAARYLRVPLRSTATLWLVVLLGLTSACGYKTSSSSFISNGTGTTVAPTVTSISVEPFNSALPRGLTRQFTATALYSDGTKADVSGSVTWSLGSAAATINATGLLTAVNLGTTTVTATLGAIAGSTPLTVTAATLVSIDITPASPSVASGKQLQLLATGNYTDFSTQNLTTTVAWSSSTPLVATISNAAGTQGVATGVTSGTVTITATLGAATGSTLLTVTGATLVSIAVTPIKPTIYTGATQQFVAIGTYSAGPPQVITDNVFWNSGTPSIGGISNVVGAQGIATGVSPGTTSITATYQNITSPAQTLTVISAHAYATNFGSNTISQYNINPTTGALTPLTVQGVPSPTVAAGDWPFSIAITPTNAFAYVANFNRNNAANGSTISQYSISAANGSLNPVITATAPAGMVATGSNPNSVTLDPSATHLYATNTNFNAPINTTQFTISQYTIGMDGSLTPILGALPLAGAQPASLAINRAGTFAYVANYNNGHTSTVSQYTINPANGALVSMANSTVLAGDGPNYVIVDPTGRYVYVANLNSNNISEYTIDPGTGALQTNVIQTIVDSGTGPSFIAIDAAGTYAYVANSGADNVSQYTIVNGVLTPMTPQTVSTGAGSEPYGLTIDATGKYLYVADRANNGVNDPGTPAISQFSINPTNGSLTPLPAAPAVNTVAAGSQPTSIVTTP